MKRRAEIKTKLASSLAALALLGSVLVACAPAASPAPPAPTSQAKAEAPVATTKPASTPAPPTPTPKPDKVSFATTTIGGADMPALVAMKKGFLAQENVDGEEVVMRTDVSLKAMVAGEVSFAFGLDSFVRAAVQGLPVKVLMATIDKPYHELVVRPEIKEGKDLKGKTIGIASAAGTTENMLRAALEHYGLSADKDATTVVMGDSGQRLAALKGGAVQGAILSPPATFQAEALGMKRMLKIADIMDSPLGALNTSEKLLKERPDLVLRVVRATMKGIKYIKDPKNKDELVNLWVTEANNTKEDALAAYADNIRSFTDNDGILSDKLMLQEIKRAMVDAKVQGDVPFSQVFDYSFVQKARQ